MVRRVDLAETSTKSNIVTEVESFINRFMVSTADLTLPNNRKPELRCSGLPFCPIRSFLELDKHEDSFNMEFYTSIGTAVHDTHQKWLTRSTFGGRIYGEWSCTNPECNRQYPPQLQPKYCKSCKGKLQYKEITISYTPEGKASTLSGHVDMVVEISSGKYIVVDFKTTDLSGKKRKYPTDWRDKYPSSPSYIVQISSYATLLRETLGLNIVATVLVFVDRANPIKRASDFYAYVKPWDENRHYKMLKWINLACSNHRKLRRLNRIINNSDFFSLKAMRSLQSMIATRPCTTPRSYSVYMEKKFYRGGCELKDACLESDKKVFKAVLEKIN